MQIIFEMKSSTARQSDFEIEITYLEQLQLICEGKLSQIFAQQVKRLQFIITQQQRYTRSNGQQNNSY